MSERIRTRRVRGPVGRAAWRRLARWRWPAAPAVALAPCSPRPAPGRRAARPRAASPRWPTSRRRRPPTSAGTSRAPRAPRQRPTRSAPRSIIADGSGYDDVGPDPPPARRRTAPSSSSPRRAATAPPRPSSRQGQHPGHRLTTQPDADHARTWSRTSRPTARRAATSRACSRRSTTKTGTLGIVISADDANWHKQAGGFVAGAQSVEPGHQVPAGADRPGRLRRRGRRQDHHRHRHRGRRGHRLRHGRRLILRHAPGRRDRDPAGGCREGLVHRCHR